MNRRAFMRCRILFVLILTVGLFTLAGAAVQNPVVDDEDIARIRAYVENRMKTDKIKGMAVGFMKDDFIWTEGFGYSDLENKTPTRADSAYRLASITKPMTAAAVLKLAEEGKIDLEAEVQRYVPYFPRKKWPVTIRHLLGHLAGISHYRDYDVEGHIKIHKDTREALAIFQDFDLVAEPGTEYSYSSYGYNLLGAVVEGASGMPYGAYMQENIWGPLGMDRTHMDSPSEILPGRVDGYQLVKGEIKKSEYVDISSRFAGGGTRSTVGDLLKFARGMMEHELHSEKTADRMFTSMSTREGVQTGYGMGWSIRPLNGRFSVNHTGSQAETKTALIIIPEENFAAAVGCNFEHANPRKYAHKIYEILFGEARLSVYTGDPVSDALITGMQDTFEYGAAHFDKTGSALTQSRRDLESSFRLFRETVSRKALDSDFDSTFRKIRAGRHPVSGRAFVKIGSYMAQKIQEDKANLESFHELGAVPFFAEYIRLSRETDGFSEEYTFFPEFEDWVLKMEGPWRKSLSMVSGINPAPYSDWNRLKKIFSDLKGMEIKPDFSRDLSDSIEYFYVSDNRKSAEKAAKIAADTYPESALPYFMQGCTALYFGDTEKADAFFRKSGLAAVDKNAAGPFMFYARGNFLWDYAGLEEKTRLFFRTGLKYFPESDLLHYAMGYVFWEESKYFLEKALELAPNNSRAWDLLKKIEK